KRPRGAKSPWDSTASTRGIAVRHWSPGSGGNGPREATVFVVSTSPSRTLEQNERSVLHPLTLLPGGTTPPDAGPRFLPALGGFRQCEPRRWARPGRVTTDRGGTDPLSGPGRRDRGHDHAGLARRGPSGRGPRRPTGPSDHRPDHRRSAHGPAGNGRTPVVHRPPHHRDAVRGGLPARGGRGLLRHLHPRDGSERGATSGTLPGAWASARGVHGRGRAGRSGRGWRPVRAVQGRAAAGVHGVPRTVRAHALAFAYRPRPAIGTGG